MTESRVGFSGVAAGSWVLASGFGLLAPGLAPFGCVDGAAHRRGTELAPGI
jgi:hypothetical protein